jgi:hypothetical protein
VRADERLEVRERQALVLLDHPRRGRLATLCHEMTKAALVDRLPERVPVRLTELHGAARPPA